eukprot:CAMPEP_0174267736 /NCGR_PEP_ID=MMETSP0439-20130205/34758_1 /TAXON_ID=0 /ORGANISM="Stereomyxa ramosa, Strain Chinc5" /LENGTH=638 /DNA_ID=CAMNT_0015355423 /DNA_START=141 /DNA_END=2054 /DNA_ORIENTATION=+
MVEEVRPVTKKEQKVIMQIEVEDLEDLSFLDDLEEQKPSEIPTRQIERAEPEEVRELKEMTDMLRLELDEAKATHVETISKMEDQLKLEEKKMLELQLQLEEEKSKNVKVIQKLEEELQENRKKQLSADDLLLQQESSRNLEVENVKKLEKQMVKVNQLYEEKKQELLKLEMTLDNMEAQKREVEDLRKVEADRLKDMEQKLKRAEDQKNDALKKLDDVEKNMKKSPSGKKTKMLLDIEELIRKLYYRDGAGLSLNDLEDEYGENWKFCEVIRSVRQTVAEMISDEVKNFYDRDPIPNSPQNIRSDIHELNNFRARLKSQKNNFVRACNNLAKEYEKKSELEYQMRLKREDLIRVALDEEACVPENRKLMDDIDKVKALLRKDDIQREEVRGYRKDRLSARTKAQHDIDELREFLHHEIEFKERSRLQGLLSNLKAANKKLSGTAGRAVLAQTIYVTRYERDRISNVILTIIKNFRMLFKSYMDDPLLDQINPMCLEPIIFLGQHGISQRDIFGKKDSVTLDLVEQLKNKFKNGNFELTGKEDPRVVAELLKEYFKDLPQPLLTWKRYPEFDRINDLSYPNNLQELSYAIEELPPVRRATLLRLVEFLDLVSRYADRNGMDEKILAERFGPLILRPRR